MVGLVGDVALVVVAAAAEVLAVAGTVAAADGEVDVVVAVDTGAVRVVDSVVVLAI